MQKITYTCDICGKQKGEANHWFMYIMDCGRFQASRWSETYADDWQHACGIGCLHTALDRALTQKAE